MIDVADDKEIRARRRPVAVLLLYFWELGWALLVASPIHAWAKAAWGAHPDGDGVLFRPGGRDLAVWFGSAGDALPVVIRTTFLLLLVGIVVAQIPLGALIAAFVRRIRAVQALGVGIRAWLPLSAAMVLFGLVQALFLGLGVFVASLVADALRARMGDGGALLIRLCIVGFFAILALFVGIIGDLARVAIGRDVAEQDPDATPTSSLTVLRRGLGVGLSTARRGFGRALLAWTWRALLGLAVFAIGWGVGSLVGGRGGFALFAGFVVHQAVVFTRTALRASWLANALRLTSSSA